MDAGLSYLVVHVGGNAVAPPDLGLRDRHTRSSHVGQIAVLDIGVRKVLCNRAGVEKGSGDEEGRQGGLEAEHHGCGCVEG